MTRGGRCCPCSISVSFKGGRRTSAAELNELGERDTRHHCREDGFNFESLSRVRLTTLGGNYFFLSCTLKLRIRKLNTLLFMVDVQPPMYQFPANNRYWSYMCGSNLSFPGRDAEEDVAHFPSVSFKGGRASAAEPNDIKERDTRQHSREDGFKFETLPENA